MNSKFSSEIIDDLVHQGLILYQILPFPYIILILIPYFLPSNIIVSPISMLLLIFEKPIVYPPICINQIALSIYFPLLPKALVLLIFTFPWIVHDPSSMPKVVLVKSFIFHMFIVAVVDPIPIELSKLPQPLDRTSIMNSVNSLPVPQTLQELTWEKSPITPNVLSPPMCDIMMPFPDIAITIWEGHGSSSIQHPI